MSLLEALTGDILLRKSGGPISSLIKSFSNSKYSHAAIFLNYETVIEAHWTGVRKIKVDEIDYEYDIFRYKSRSPFDKAEDKRMKYFLESQLGIKYDYSQLLGYLKFGFVEGNEWNTPNEMICSELVDLAYFTAWNLNLMPGVPSGDITPGQIAKSELLIKV